MIDGLNRAGADWIAIKRILFVWINAAQTSLETTGIDQAATEYLRGQIAAWRRLINEGEPVKVEHDTSDDNYNV